MGIPVTAEATDPRLHDATQGLLERAPELSAHHVLTTPQKVGVLVTVVLVAACGLFNLGLTARTLVGTLTLAYVATLTYRIVLLVKGAAGRHLLSVTDDEARALDASDLPVYTVLVPAFHEPLIGEIIEGLIAMEYPSDKLDIRLLLEADDDETVNAARASRPPKNVTLVLVPPSQPRTKPRPAITVSATRRANW